MLVDHAHLAQDRPHALVGKQPLGGLLAIAQRDHAAAQQVGQQPVIGIVAGGEDAAPAGDVEGTLVLTARDVQHTGLSPARQTHQQLAEIDRGQRSLLHHVAGSHPRLVALLDHAEHLEAPDHLIHLEVGQEHFAAQLVQTGVALAETLDQRFLAGGEHHAVEQLSPTLA